MAHNRISQDGLNPRLFFNKTDENTELLTLVILPAWQFLSDQWLGGKIKQSEVVWNYWFLGPYSQIVFVYGSCTNLNDSLIRKHIFKNKAPCHTFPNSRRRFRFTRMVHHGCWTLEAGRTCAGLHRSTLIGNSGVWRLVAVCEAGHTVLQSLQLRLTAVFGSDSSVDISCAMTSLRSEYRTLTSSWSI